MPNDVYAQTPDGTYLQFPDGTKPEVIQKAVKTYLASKPGASSATSPPTVRSQSEAKAQTAANIGNLTKNLGITPEAARAQGVVPAVRNATSQHADAQQAQQQEAARKALLTAQIYRMHGQGMGDDPKRRKVEADAANQASARLQSVVPDRGTLLNQIQPHFDETLAQQGGKKGAVQKKAAGLLNSAPDLALLALTEGAADIPELLGQSLITRGFQAQQVAGLVQEAKDKEMLQKDPGQYWTSLLLGTGLAAAPDLMKAGGKAITKTVEDAKAKQTTNQAGGPSISAKDAATRDTQAKLTADRKARNEAASKAKRTAEISRVKVNAEVGKPNASVKPAVAPVVKPKPVEGTNTPPSEKGPSNPKPETVSGSITPETVKSLAKDGFTKAADLFAAAKKANPKLTREEFAQQLYEFHKGDTHNYEGPSGRVDQSSDLVFKAKSADGRTIPYYGFSEKTGGITNAIDRGVDDGKGKADGSGLPVVSNGVPGWTAGEPQAVLPSEPSRTATEEKVPVPDRNKSDTEFKPPVVKASPAQGHNTTNEIVNRARASMGLDELPKAQRTTWGAVSKHVEDTGMYHPEETGKVAQRVLRGGHAMSQEEVVANNYRQHMIMHETSDLRDQIDAGIKSGQDVESKRVRLAFLEGEFETLTDATKRTGTLTSQALNIRKATLPKYDHNVVMQRLAHAKPGVEPTPEEKAAVGEAAKVARAARKKATDANTKSDPADELRSKHAAAEAVRELRKGVRQGKKADLDAELKTHIDRLLKATSQLNAGVDPAIIPIVKDIAVNRLKVAALSADALVDEVHRIVSEHLPDVSKRDIRDAISGYGQDPQAAKRSHLTDLKEEMKLLSEIEDTKAGVQREQKIRTARQPSPEVARLRKERADLKAANKPPRPSPARAPKPPTKTEMERKFDNQKARLNKQIENLDERIGKGNFSKNANTPAPTDPEIEALKARRDSLKRVYDSLDPATEAKARAREARSVERENATEVRKQRASDIRDKRTQIHKIENDLRGLDKKSPWDVKETVGIRDNLQAQLKQANAELDAITTGPHRTADPLTAYKIRKQAEIDALDKQIGAGKADPPKEPFKLNRDRDAEALDAEARRKEDVVDNLIKKREGKDWQDKLIAYRRFAVLSRVGTLFKLGAAASERMIFSPLEEVTGLPAQLLTGKNVARNAPTQGGLSARAELAAGQTFFSRKTWTKDAVDKLMTGKHDLDARLGHNEYDEGEKLGVLNFMGRLHGAIKTPAQMAAFERAQIKGTAWAERQGLDVNDPDVQAHVDAMAYQESLRAILMQDNVAVGMYKGVINTLERYDHPAGKATATLMKAAMPIVKVPTNFAGEVGLHVAGAGRAAWEVVGAKLAGKDLSPEQCDIVLRSLKKQGVGGMMFALGYFNADKMGGTYVPGDKNRKQEYGSIKIGDWTVSHQFLHNPAIEAAQLGATFARTQKEGKVNPAYAMGVGMTESVPFLDVAKRAAEVSGGDKKFSKAAGEEIGGMIFPGIMNEIGGNFNKDAQGKQIKRKPQTFLDEMKVAAGLQAFLPTENPSSRSKSLSSMMKEPKPPHIKTTL